MLVFGGSVAPGNSAGHSCSSSECGEEAASQPLVALDRRGQWHTCSRFLTLSAKVSLARTGLCSAATSGHLGQLLVSGGSPWPVHDAATTPPPTATMCSHLNLWTPEAPVLQDPKDAAEEERAPEPQDVDTSAGHYLGFLDAAGKFHGKGRMEYTDGDVYDGTWDAGQRSGQGTCVYAAGGSYDGAWKRNKHHGQGKMTYGGQGKGPAPPTAAPAGAPAVPPAPAAANVSSRWVEEFDGSWKDGLRHGEGQLRYSDGALLKATWTKGKLDPASSMLLTLEGAMVRGGRYTEGELLVEGTEETAKGDKYSGGFDASGRRHGEGVCEYHDGSTYQGQWRNGKRNGKGKFVDGKTREEYDGKWMADQRHGRGLCMYPAGHRYEGTWRQGKFHGEGTFFHANGDNYSGNWVQGKREGHGVHTDSHGRVVSGSWKGSTLLFSEDHDTPEATSQPGDLATEAAQ